MKDVANTLNQLISLKNSLNVTTNQTVEITLPATKDVLQLCGGLPNDLEITFEDAENLSKINLDEICSSFILSISPKVVTTAFNVVDRLISDDSKALSSLQKTLFYISSEEQFLSPKHKAFQKLEFISKLIYYLSELKDHYDTSEYIFWADRKIIISKQFDSEEFIKLITDLKKLDDFFDEVLKNEHGKERRILFNSALKRLSDEEAGKDLRLFDICNRLDRIVQLWHEGFFAFLHDLDYEEMREKFLEKIQDTHESIGNVLTGAQIRILAIPLAIVLAFGKALDTSLTADMQIVIFFGLLMLIVAGGMLFQNTKEDLLAVFNRYISWKKEMKSSKFLEDYKSEIDELDTRILNQKLRATILSYLYWFFVFTSVVVLFRTVF